MASVIKLFWANTFKDFLSKKLESVSFKCTNTVNKRQSKVTKLIHSNCIEVGVGVMVRSHRLIFKFCQNMKQPNGVKWSCFWLHISQVNGQPYQPDVCMEIHSQLSPLLGKTELIAEHFCMSGKTQKQSNSQ